MDAASDPDIGEIIGIFASQAGKTEFINNVLGFHIEHDPCPILLLQPTLEMAEAYSKDRLTPMLRDSPSLRACVREARSRDSGNTVHHKQFVGGHITMVGANSPASLASRPIRILLADEIDRYPVSVGTEGDPLKLAETRTVAFWNRKRIYITSPTVHDSVSWRIWERSDKRRFFVPCHACGAEQFLKWSQVDFGGKDEQTGEHRPERARYACERCGELWTDAQRSAAVRRGRWIATAPFKGCAGFHVNALAAPGPTRRLEVLVSEFLAAQGHHGLLRTFAQTVLAEWWEEKYHALDEDEILKRREPYPLRGDLVVAPRGVVVITAGVDVQDDRIEMQVQGYGVAGEQWKLQYHVLDGDPSGIAVWTDLWALLVQPIPLERGGEDFIRATCVDTGAHSLKAYDFVRPRQRYQTRDKRNAYVFAIKGKQGQTEQFWPRVPTRTNKGKVPLYIVRVDHAKEALYASLAKITERGPGYVHFPDRVSVGSDFDRRYFQQLTAEKATDTAQPNGLTKREWKLKSEGRRNEGLDTSVYGEAALAGLQAMGFDLEREALKIGARERAARATEARERLRARTAAQDEELEEQPDDLGGPPRSAARRRGRRSSKSQWLQRE